MIENESHPWYNQTRHGHWSELPYHVGSWSRWRAHISKCFIFWHSVNFWTIIKFKYLNETTCIHIWFAKSLRERPLWQNMLLTTSFRLSIVYPVTVNCHSEYHEKKNACNQGIYNFSSRTETCLDRVSLGNHWNQSFLLTCKGILLTLSESISFQSCILLMIMHTLCMEQCQVNRMRIMHWLITFMQLKHHKSH